MVTFVQATFVLVMKILLDLVVLNLSISGGQVVPCLNFTILQHCVSDVEMLVLVLPNPQCPGDSRLHNKLTGPNKQYSLSTVEFIYQIPDHNNKIGLNLAIV